MNILPTQLAGSDENNYPQMVFNSPYKYQAAHSSFNPASILKSPQIPFRSPSLVCREILPLEQVAPAGIPDEPTFQDANPVRAPKSKITAPQSKPTPLFASQGKRTLKSPKPAIKKMAATSSLNPSLLHSVSSRIFSPILPPKPCAYVPLPVATPPSSYEEPLSIIFSPDPENDGLVCYTPSSLPLEEDQIFPDSPAQFDDSSLDCTDYTPYTQEPDARFLEMFKYLREKETIQVTMAKTYEELAQEDFEREYELVEKATLSDFLVDDTVEGFNMEYRKKAAPTFFELPKN